MSENGGGQQEQLNTVRNYANEWNIMFSEQYCKTMLFGGAQDGGWGLGDDVMGIVLVSE